MESLLHDLPTILMRVVLLQRSKVNSLTTKQQRKKEVKERADMDVDEEMISKKSIRDLIAKEVKKASNSKGPKKGKAPKGGKQQKSKKDSVKVSNRFHPYNPHSSTPLEGGVEEGQEVLKGLGLDQEEATELQRQREGQGPMTPLSLMASEWSAGISAGAIRYESPLDWPDWIIDIPIRWAILILVRTLAPLHLLRKNSLRHSVHIGDNVIVNEDTLPLLRELSIGYKFLIPTHTQPGLIKLAWKDFCEHLRWRVYFAKRLLTDDEFEPGTYDPDYKVLSTRKEPPNGDGVIEAAIREGEAYVNNVIANIPSADNSPNPYGKFVKRLHDFLSENDYVVVPTDKNLGISIVTRE